MWGSEYRQIRLCEEIKVRTKSNQIYFLGDFKMKRAVIYINETSDGSINKKAMDIIQRYCDKRGYVITAILGEKSPSGMSLPMKYSFIGMEEVEDIDVIVTLSSGMVAPTNDEVLETIALLEDFGVEIETVRGDMAAYYYDLDCRRGCDGGADSADDMDDTDFIEKLDEFFRSNAEAEL
jgi:hypothetical protein